MVWMFFPLTLIVIVLCPSVPSFCWCTKVTEIELLEVNTISNKKQNILTCFLTLSLNARNDWAVFKRFWDNSWIYLPDWGNFLERNEKMHRAIWLLYIQSGSSFPHQKIPVLIRIGLNYSLMWRTIVFNDRVQYIWFCLDFQSRFLFESRFLKKKPAWHLTYKPSCGYKYVLITQGLKFKLMCIKN